MTEIQLLILVAAALFGLAIAGVTVLKVRQAWLDIKRPAVARPVSPDGTASPATRIMLADLKERVRRLERIAEGIE
jgi:hypothetical protein